MSLINDALKRAKQAQKFKPTAPPGGGPGLQPHDGKNGSSKWPMLVLIAVLALGGGGYWYFFIKGGKAPKVSSLQDLWKRPGATNAAKTTAAANKGATNKVAGRSGLTNRSGFKMAAGPVSNEVAASNHGQTGATRPGMTPPQPANVPIPPGPNNGATVRTEVAMAPQNLGSPKTGGTSEAPGPGSNPSAGTASGSTESAPLKLQGIFYRLSKPSVLINGQTLYRGDSIEGSRIIDISRHTVVVERNGQTQTLAFSQKQ